MIELNKIYNEDCLEGMKRIPDKSVDMILCDLPYGTTACKWDTIIPFEPLWEQYERVIKDDGAIVLNGAEPFSSVLRVSKLELYKYDWIWRKNKSTNHLNSKFQPLKNYEKISVFSKAASTYSPKGNMKYYPQGVVALDSPKQNTRKGTKIGETYNTSPNVSTLQKYKNYPKSVIEFQTDSNTIHPTQKPIALFEYLIRTYTNENETILDNCMGSGTTAISCINTNRNFIGFELDEKYFNLANDRIAKHLQGGG